MSASLFGVTSTLLVYLYLYVSASSDEMLSVGSASRGIP